MDDGRKQLHLRTNREKPVLKFASGPGHSSSPQTGAANTGTQDHYQHASHGYAKTSSQNPGNSRPLAIPLYNKSDVQMYKQQMYSNFVNNYAPVYSPGHIGAGMQSGAMGARNAPYNNFTFLTGPGTPSGQGLTPGHLLASSVMTHPPGDHPHNVSKNPYARPISAQDVLSDNTNLAKNLGVNTKGSASNTSLSSCVSNTSLHSNVSNAHSNGAVAASPPQANRSQITPSGMLQTNSFMRPQSALDTSVKHDKSQAKLHQHRAQHHSAATPSETPYTCSATEKHVTGAASQPAIALKPQVTRAPSADKTGIAIKAKPVLSHRDVSSSPKVSANLGNQSGSAHTDNHSNQASASHIKCYSGSSNGSASARNNNGAKNTDNIGTQSIAMATGTQGPPQASTASYGRNGVHNWVMNKHGSQSSFKSVPVNNVSGQAVVGKAASLTNQFQPRSRRPASSTSSRTGVTSRPGSGLSMTGSTGSNDSQARVRNLNYTPTKPYEEIVNADESERGDPLTSDERRTEALNNKINGGMTRKNVSFSSHALEISPQMLLDGRVKEMPVTHTLTGTIYYRKSSKAEKSPPTRTVADGAPAVPLKRDPPLPNKAVNNAAKPTTKRPPSGKNRAANAGATQRQMTSSGATHKAVTSRAEEWTDEEEGGLEEDGEESPQNALFRGERLPGDGEAAASEVTGNDDDDVDDAFDDEDEDALDTLDESDGQSEDSERYDAAPAAQPPVRLKSATKRLLGLSISDSSTPPSRAAKPPRAASARPVSALSTLSSDSDLQPALMPSLFPHVPPTVNFVGDGQKVESLPWEIRKLLKWKVSTITPNVVKNCINRSGFRFTKNNHDWIGYWGKHMKAQGFKAIREYQKVNHFPGSFQIGRKDRLWRNLSKMQVHFGKKEFSFFPQTFVLPFDMKLLKRQWEDGGNKQKWIIKPPASARGIGIKVIAKWNQIPKKRPVIVQKYLSRPYLINDSKFDMRLYIYVTSYDPLRVYLYEDGLVRFASVKYSSSMKSINNRYMHLTNYSIQKKSSDYKSNTDESVCQGHKWGLKALWGYLKQRGVNTAAVWDNIKDMVIKTIISSDQYVNPLMKGNVRRRYSCHELFGFDVMLDDTLKPWIIEVNISPSLHSNSQLDMNIKGGMIRDLLNLAGFMIPDKQQITDTPAANHSGAKYVVPNEICLDKRLWPACMAPDERVKHAYYCQRHNDEAVQATILDTITPEDLRYLVEACDEESRRGNFERIFPSASTHKYLRYFESSRYSNLLLNAWCNKFHRMNARGIAYLESVCARGVHLENPTEDPRHQWAPPNTTSMLNRDSRIYSAPSSSKPGTRVLPQLRKNKQYSATSSNTSQSSTPLATTRSAGQAIHEPH